MTEILTHRGAVGNQFVIFGFVELVEPLVVGEAEDDGFDGLREKCEQVGVEAEDVRTMDGRGNAEGADEL